jgi:hypothetical protein
MNKTLYEEALADAKKLRELAEETAKHRVIESIMPQIKSLVDSRIIGEQAVDLTVDPGEDIDALDMMPSFEDEEPYEDIPEDLDAPEGNVLNITAQGDVNIDLSASEDSEEDFVLTDTMAEAVRDILVGKTKYVPSVAERVTTLSNTVSKLKAVHEALEGSIPNSKKRRFNLAFAYCVKEAMNLRSQLILMEHGTQDWLERKLTETIKEMKTMSKSNRNIFDFLFEAEEDKKKVKELEEAELSLELEDEEKEELAGAEDAEAVDTALEDILGDLEVAMGDAEVEDELAGDELAGDDEPAEEEGEELDLEEMDEMEEVYEIDESVLRRELRKMRRLREQEEAVDTYAVHPAEDLGDVFDVDEDDLINVLADELGPVGEGDAVEPEELAESRIARRVRARRAAQTRRGGRRRSGRVNEAAVVRKYKGTVNVLKKQLVEMNLFNAKLLYANKLMQNKNLSVKQQRAIVEALDNAKTIREAKLLYKSLSESLTRRARGKKLNEGALRTLGSSSRSTRSAQPASSGVEVDRWAVLAGLNGKN